MRTAWALFNSKLPWMIYLLFSPIASGKCKIGIDSAGNRIISFSLNN